MYVFLLRGRIFTSQANIKIASKYLLPKGITIKRVLSCGRQHSFIRIKNTDELDAEMGAVRKLFLMDNVGKSDIASVTNCILDEADCDDKCVNIIHRQIIM